MGKNMELTMPLCKSLTTQTTRLHQPSSVRKQGYVGYTEGVVQCMVWEMRIPNLFILFIPAMLFMYLPNSQKLPWIQGQKKIYSLCSTCAKTSSTIPSFNVFDCTHSKLLEFFMIVVYVTRE